MTDTAHTHRSVSDWIRLFEDADDRDTVLTSCPRAREAWREGTGAWLAHIADCTTCREIARVQETFADALLDCPECRSNLELVYDLLAETEHYEPSTVWELERAEQFLAEIAPLTLEEQMKRALAEPFYQQWGFVQRLLLDARAHWHRDPEHALDRSLLAVVAAQELDPESYGERWIADLEAKAHAYVANAHRILGRFGQAEAEFDLAEECLRRGVGSGQAEARVLALKASLLNDQRRHREALALLDHLERFYLKRGESHEVGRLALQRSHVLHFLGQCVRAAEESASAAANLDPRRDPLLPLLAKKNAVEHLLSAGQTERARALFDELPQIPDEFADLRRCWVEANLLRAEGHHSDARRMYERVRSRFTDHSFFYDVALLSLDLALTAHQEGAPTSEVQRMAEEATVQLTLANAKPEAFTALRILLQAAQEDALSVAVLRKIRRRVAALQPS